MVFHAVSLVHSLEQSCLSSCNYTVIFVSKKLADLWIHFIIFSSLLLFLKDTFTGQMKDHCGIQVVPSKAGPLGGGEGMENGNTDIVWRGVSGWKQVLLPYQKWVHLCFLQMPEFSWWSRAITPKKWKEKTKTTPPPGKTKPPNIAIL